MIEKFYDLYLRKRCKLFLNSFLDCIHFLNNKLIFSNDIANYFQQITSDTLLFFIQTSIFSMKNQNVNISDKNYINFAILNTNTIVNAIDYLKISKLIQN